MRIDFRTRHGKRIGSVTLLQFVTSWSAFLVICMFIFTSGKTFHEWYEALRANLMFLHPAAARHLSFWDGLIKVVLTPWFALIKILAAGIAFYLAATRLVRGSWLWLAQGVHRHVFLEQRLVTNKIREELDTYPNQSTDRFHTEIENAVRDIELLEEASRLGRITNPTTQAILWAPAHRLKKFAETPNSHASREHTLKKCCEKLAADASGLNGAVVRFFVSPVQPSILYALDRVIRMAGIEAHVDIRSYSDTGPQTLHNATADIAARTLDERKGELRMFAAPLSAYVMFDPESAETPEEPLCLSDWFEATCMLLREAQDILVVDDGNRVPVRNGKMYYYNNSTAEECWAKSYPATSQIFTAKAVDNYDDYLAYLKGKVPLKPGDAIITWPPLTRYYEGRSAGPGYFNGGAVFDEHATNISRIVLFAEKRCGDSNPRLAEFGDTLTQALLKMLLQLRLHYERRRIHPHLIDHWRFLRAYRTMFSAILGT